MASVGAKGSLERDCNTMTLRQPPLAMKGGSSAVLYIHSMPAWVLEDFCRKMDCLSDYDWMRFASYVITDQTELRKIKCMEKTGISITRELMWWWGVRLATVQQLLDLLQGLQLYRAAQVILDWTSASNITSSEKELLVEPPKQEYISLTPTENKKRERENEISLLPLPDSSHSGVSPADSAVSEGALCSLPFPPPPPRDLLKSLQSNPPVSSSVKPCSSSAPQQETITDLPSGSLLWTQREVTNATGGFSDKNRICEGTFAEVYKGQRNNIVYVIKRLKEMECTSPDSTQRFFHTEVQICFRCCHVNILQLLGFSVETGLHCLIYPYLPNGSLQNKLHCQDDSALLTWEMRISISIGLLRAVEYLHNSGILHGNIKSSNVLLDENFTPKLGHSGLRLYSVDKKSEYAVMKTKVLQASLTYLPEDFVRHGRLTEKVDIFGCGVVLAEILTGIKALDEGRHPIYLKDMIADEIQMAKESSYSKVKKIEKLAAKEICCKYLDRKAGHLPEEVAIDFASAICLCLRKKNSNIAEVLEIMEMAENKLREHYFCGSIISGFSMNTPEETDDETTGLSMDAPSVGENKEDGAQPAILTSANPCTPLTGVVSPDIYCGQMSRVPCESDESTSFIWNPSERSTDELPSNACNKSENMSASDYRLKQVKPANGLQERNAACARSDDILERTSTAQSTFQQRNADLESSCSSQALARETSWNIKINDQKKKLMENILLYEENKLNSSELFES
ncbi:interleukin-1 receptor-associated kinase-like 2 isoform X1 [Cuculus canorus]|uniref:interleukin-1 receptor-associated kinase-like 2 isoform X1 n=2 Tax=Cuculus canorus TaxID=55661 RepID=UPI0023AAFF05|nr:interleukin-1 receptor-associated kinase-like 2 isoform X1 [Cuculus canorus]XP_053932644.1 interleukin-1 receptor-associated kinase-like 2 isoform X1 [Cuculus canorus]